MKIGGLSMKKLLIPTQVVGMLLITAAPALATHIGGLPHLFPPAGGGTAGTIGIPKRGPVAIGDLGVLVGSILGILLIIAAILAFLYLILGGIQWITSGGDKAGLEAARNKITNAIVGLVIVAAAWAVMFLVGQFLGLDGLFSEGGAIDIPRAY